MRGGEEVEDGADDCQCTKKLNPAAQPCGAARGRAVRRGADDCQCTKKLSNAAQPCTTWHVTP